MKRRSPPSPTDGDNTRKVPKTSTLGSLGQLSMSEDPTATEEQSENTFGELIKEFATHIANYTLVQQLHANNEARAKAAESEYQKLQHHFPKFPPIKEQREAAVKDSRSKLAKSKINFDRHDTQLTAFANALAVTLSTVNTNAGSQIPDATGDAIRAENDELKNEIRDAKDIIRWLEQRVNQIEQNVISAESQAQQTQSIAEANLLKSQFDQSQERIEKIGESIESFKDAIDQREREIRRLQSELIGVQGLAQNADRNGKAALKLARELEEVADNEPLQSRLQSFRNELEANGIGITTQAAAPASIKANELISKLENSVIPAINKRVDGVENDIEVLQTSMDDKDDIVAKEMEGQSSRITKLETEQAAMGTVLAGLSNKKQQNDLKFVPPPSTGSQSAPATTPTTNAELPNQIPAGIVQQLQRIQYQTDAQAHIIQSLRIRMDNLTTEEVVARMAREACRLFPSAGRLQEDIGKLHAKWGEVQEALGQTAQKQDGLVKRVDLLVTEVSSRESAAKKDTKDLGNKFDTLEEEVTNFKKTFESAKGDFTEAQGRFSLLERKVAEIRIHCEMLHRSVDEVVGAMKLKDEVFAAHRSEQDG